MFDVEVKNTNSNSAVVVIDLGDGHKLGIRVTHNTDRFRGVGVWWELPAHVTGPTEEIRDRSQRSIAKITLDFQERATMDTGDAQRLRARELARP